MKRNIPKKRELDFRNNYEIECEEVNSIQQNILPPNCTINNFIFYYFSQLQGTNNEYGDPISDEVIDKIIARLYSIIDWSKLTNYLNLEILSYDAFYQYQEFLDWEVIGSNLPIERKDILIGFGHKIDWTIFTNGLFNRYEEGSIPTNFLEEFDHVLDWNLISYTPDFLSNEQVIHFSYCLNLTNLLNYYNLDLYTLDYLLQDKKIKLYDILNQNPSQSSHIHTLSEEVIFKYLIEDIENFKLNIMSLFQIYKIFTDDFLNKVLNEISINKENFYPNDLQLVLENILSNQNISEELVLTYQNLFTWDSISCYYNSTNEFLYKYENSLNLKKLFTHRKLDNEYWDKNFHKYIKKPDLLELILINQRIKEELILEYKEKLDLEYVLHYQSLSLDTLISFYNYLLKKDSQSPDRRFKYEDILFNKIYNNKVINSSTKQKFKDFVLLIK
jgi:hypothetical protein